jgi:hypothetical protein
MRNRQILGDLLFFKFRHDPQSRRKVSFTVGPCFAHKPLADPSSSGNDLGILGYDIGILTEKCGDVDVNDAAPARDFAVPTSESTSWMRSISLSCLMVS